MPTISQTQVTYADNKVLLVLSSGETLTVTLDYNNSNQVDAEALAESNRYGALLQQGVVNAILRYCKSAADVTNLP